MKVLIACEESQTVCKAFQTKGHEAYSADIQDCSGGHPEWHIKGDVLPIINGNADFVTMDGTAHRIDGKWDLLIAHPPCTYLTNVATRHYSLKCTPAEKVIDRMEHREEAIVFFMQCMLADAPRIAVENPVGRMGISTHTPHTGCDPLSVVALPSSSTFQLTHPTRERKSICEVRLFKYYYCSL